VLEKPLRRLLGQLDHHLAQDHCNVREPVVSLTNVVEASFVEQNFLENKCCHCFAQLRPALHDAQAEGDDLSGEEEVDNLLLIRLDKSSNDSKRGKPQVLKWPGLRDGVEEWVEVEWDMRQQEGRPGVRMGGHTLKQCQRIAHSVALMSSQHRRIDGRIDVDDLLEESSHCAKGVP